MSDLLFPSSLTGLPAQEAGHAPFPDFGEIRFGLVALTCAIKKRYQTLLWRIQNRMDCRWQTHLRKNPWHCRVGNSTGRKRPAPGARYNRTTEMRSLAQMLNYSTPTSKFASCSRFQTGCKQGAIAVLVHRGFVGSGKGNQSFQLWAHIANMPQFTSLRHAQTRMVWLPSMPDQDGLVTVHAQTRMVWSPSMPRPGWSGYRPCLTRMVWLPSMPRPGWSGYRPCPDQDGLVTVHAQTRMVWLPSMPDQDGLVAIETPLSANPR